MTMERVVISINNKDQSEFKDLFSKTVCENDVDIEEDISLLFDYIQGEIVECKFLGGLNTSEMREDGQHIKEIKACYLISTETQKYNIAIRERVVDRSDQNSIGIYSFNIINDNEWKNEYLYGAGGAQIAGVHIEKNMENSSVSSDDTTE